MAETILRCWVINTPTDEMFPVKIERDNVWGAVKDKIKKLVEPEFDDIAARTLKLWKVPLWRSESYLEQNLKEITATKPLDPFKPVGSEGLFIIVQRPPAKLNPIASSTQFDVANSSLSGLDGAVPHDTDGDKKVHAGVSPLTVNMIHNSFSR